MEEGLKLRKLLKDGDTFITAYAQYAKGPGWRNCPVWVIIRERGGALREECLQPEEQGNGIASLYDFSALAHQKMLAAVEVREFMADRKGRSKGT